MSVRHDNEVIHLEGDCLVEDSETLVALLQNNPGQAVDVSFCQNLHSSMIQVLLAFRPAIRGACRDEFLQTWIISDLIDPPEGVE